MFLYGSSACKYPISTSPNNRMQKLKTQENWKRYVKWLLTSVKKGNKYWPWTLSRQKRTTPAFKKDMWIPRNKLYFGR